MTTARQKLMKQISLSLMIIAGILLIKPSYLYAKSILAQILLEHAWQTSQQEGEKSLPWQWSDSYPVAKLSYPKGDNSWIILAGMTGRAMAFAPSWLEDSAQPNQYGNTVISAHNDSHFKALENTAVGDSFLLEDREGRVVSYQVVSVGIISKSNASPYQFQDETMITLITCYPFEVSHIPKNQRLVIQAVKKAAVN